MKYITCKICGERVQSKSSMKQYCAECLRERRNAFRREYMRDKRQREKFENDPNGAIRKDVCDAMNAGVSYGKYKAMQKDTAYIEEKARERRRKNNPNNQKEGGGEK